MADACAALLVGDTGFHTEGEGVATASGVCNVCPRILAESGELGFPPRASTSWLQEPNAIARYTRRETYAPGTNLDVTSRER